jgi:alpha-beta hydrolase superfamily lysophospholipase
MNDWQSLDRLGEPRLAFHVQKPSGATRGRVLMVHGYADHSARYDHVVARWLEQGLTVARFDLRGHGRSGGPRGHVDHFEDYVRDVRDLLNRLRDEPVWAASVGKPILFAHSMGGLISSYAAAELGDGIAGLAMTSPFFGVARPVPAIQVAIGKVVARVAPRLRQPSGLQAGDMTHDAARVKAYAEDPLGFQHVTVGWFLEIQRAQASAVDVARRLSVPVFCIAGGDDRVVSLDATRRFFGALGTATRAELVVLPGLFHEVLNEPEYRELATRLGDRMISWVGT